MFKEILITLYFQDHLSKHLLQMSKLLIIIENNVGLEIINMLILLIKKYSFIKLKKIQTNAINIDFQNYLNNISRYKHTQLTLLICINTRYESTLLNLKLKKNPYKFLALNSLTDLTFSISYIGLALKNLKTILEGNNFFCQELLMISADIFRF